MPHLAPIIIPGGRSIVGYSLGFHAYSLRIDNLSNQWLQEESSLAWIPPYSLGTSLRLYGTAVAIILNQAPQGQPQPTPIQGEYAAGFYSDELRTEVPGVPVRQFTIVQAVSDLTQGPEPGFPPVGVDRLWADTSGLIHHLHSNGQDTILTDPLQTGVVLQAMLAKPSVGTGELIDGNVFQAKLAKPCIGTPEISDQVVTQAKLTKPSVGTAELFDLNVTTAKIQDQNVTQGKLAKPSVGTPEIFANAVTRVAYDASVSGDQWVNASYSAGDNSVPAHPITVSVDPDAQFYIVTLECAALLQTVVPAGTFYGWDLNFQNTMVARLSRTNEAVANQQMMVSCAASHIIAGTGASSLQFGAYFYASAASASGLYLQCASLPNINYVRMQVLTVRR